MVQLYTDDQEHNYLSDAQYIAMMNALLTWIDEGKKPTVDEVSKICRKLDEKWEPQSNCHFAPEFKPNSLFSSTPLR